MSMNDNLEVRVSELTDIIKNMSNKPMYSSVDVNNLLNNLIQKVENANEEGFYKLAIDITESLSSALDKKNEDIKERLSVFETFIAAVEKTIQNPKVEAEVTRILNDIEALHAKMSSQELQTEGLVKAFESYKNVSATGQISKLCDEIVTISKSYDGIVEVLNNNFQEFLRKVEAISSREEFQRLRYLVESVEGNQNVLVSAMNALGDKQEEIKNIIKQSSASQTVEKIEQLQGMLNQTNRLVLDVTSKADLEVVVDKIAALGNLLSEFKRSVDENNDADVRNVFQGQLNNIISKLESLKIDNNSNVNEDIIRLYTSIAEFKDGVYSAISTRLNDVVASMDVQFDKISNSMVNATLDAGENITNLTGEVQKLSSAVEDGLTLQADEIKQNIQRIGQDNVITVVNSIKGELSSLMRDLASLNNSDGIAQLSKNIEALQSGIDIDSLILQMDQIKSALDLDPIKEQLMILNKNEALSEINNKIDLVLESFRADEVLNKIDELEQKTDLSRVYTALDNVNQKIDFTSVEEKISDLKEFLSGVDFSSDVSKINEKLETLDSIKEELISVKNIDSALFEVKGQIEEILRVSLQKKEEAAEEYSDIKDALSAIYQMVSEEKQNPLDNLSGEVKDIVETTMFEISNKIEKLQDVSLNSINSNGDEIKDGLSDLRGSVEQEIVSLKNYFTENLDSNLNDKISALFENLELKIGEKLSSIQAKAEEARASENSNIEANLKEGLSDIQFEIKTSLASFVEQTNSSQTDAINDFVKIKIDEANLDINSRLKDEIEKSVIQISDKTDAIKEELSDKISSLIKETEGTDEKLEIINTIKEAIDEAVKNQALLKGNVEENANSLGVIAENLNLIYSKLSSSILSSDFDIEEILNKIGENIDELTSKTSELSNKENLLNSEFALNAVNENVKKIQIIIEELLKECLIKIQEKSGVSAALAATGQAKIEETIANNNLEVKNAIFEITESLESNNLKINETLAENSTTIENAFASMGEKVDAISGKIANASEKNKTAIMESIDDINSNLDSLHEKVESSIQKVDLGAESSVELVKQIEGMAGKFEETREKQTEEIKNAVVQALLPIITSDDKFEEAKKGIISALISLTGEKSKSVHERFDAIANELGSNHVEANEKIDEIRRNVNLGIDKLTEQFKEELEEIKSYITAQVSRAGNYQEDFSAMAGEVEEKIQNQVSSIEVLIEDASRKLDSKVGEVVQTCDEGYRTKLDDAVEQLKSDFENKMTDIHKVVDEKVYDIVNRNNEVIKDELKLRADAVLKDLSKDFKDKISKIESYFSKYENSTEDGEEEHTYTLADVESDIAKIRLGLEKSNKLSNFKEFAARLVELKNINLENAKISRVIGADIMRFDSWLKSATAKIDVLAAKIDKSEKIKMEDLKSRLIQSEKNQAMPQKLEEAIITIYKKYRTQENKIEEMITKLDSLNQKQSDTFDVKEFIDLFYDNTKKQETLMNRMNDIEDKMDLIQAKIDHIISSCIDE